MVEPKPLSDEELKQIEKAMIDMDIPEWKQGHILALTPFVTPEYRRFLDTIAADRKRIKELMTPCKCDPLGSGEEYCNGGCYQTDTIADLKAKRTADKEVFDGYIGDWGDQKRKFQKRIEELEKGRDDSLDDFADHLEKVANQHLTNLQTIADQAATIKRLRGETVPKELLLRYLSQRIRYYDENKFPEWSRALNDAIVKAYTWLKMLIRENKLEGATNEEAANALDKKE
jgi:hypothetical protein